MILEIEKLLYDFLFEKLAFKNVNVYRGILPDTKHSDREDGKRINELFPFALLRLTEFKQSRNGIDGYEVPVDFEIWIGTKLNDENDYMANLELGDYLKKEFLSYSTIDNGFAIDQSYPFSIEYFSGEADPYFYSVCKFRVYGIPDTSNVVNDRIDKLLGRSKK